MGVRVATLHATLLSPLLYMAEHILSYLIQYLVSSPSVGNMSRAEILSCNNDAPQHMQLGNGFFHTKDMKQKNRLELPTQKYNLAQNNLIL